MEEVAATAAGGELGGYTTGAVFTNVVSVCRDLGDYRRGIEWSDAAMRWAERQQLDGFPGICRVHRAAILRMLGQLREAERRGDRRDRGAHGLQPGSTPGAAQHELGEVQLRLGDLDAAEEAFRRARPR